MKVLRAKEKSFSQIKWLLTSTSKSWLEQALSNPIEVLIDHANCERKAAGVAIQMMFRYLSEPGLAEVLSPLAREELDHFEKVLEILKSKGRYLEPLAAPPYGALLTKNVRKEEPLRMLDSFLVAGLIEARSHERMSLLALHSLDKDIKDLYADLLESEARHFGVYWKLAEKRFEKSLILSRMKELAEIESNILSELYCQPRMHS
ncbi:MULTISPECIES: tRNA-(ms[2]io[6]A)-hydroxylase [Prochlorococcus]|uniref:Probable hydroxylase for synthesis of 2-methylthio-cis-ribozeatin in tRNA n=1 Tax=Prochlorococcus marinus (strain SARG / CCMP1375 / SS120) TaxID=167539 RepID=Q7VDJ1_PROMA|nr:MULTISPECIES: tRNA-(ms[2]io[6]A)-hydroxylase [Prochlorococcus]AAP99431.1 Probable hydroxylase for synthesis of 2-methylthio-cis-ribozeatin in tRNA [Prochlorococcus marinus subsp. marinus str. CCMP1375]KGG11301.1 tRNA-(ms(2)io(6)A)-hydroxylase [Prochlorococcus marinus str. LG]KGG18745.1 tRNA-(ms(2)io(6)A)-hydroxylase [Prochlorococcus marinus str. SS2]KGG23018.1 tRNA-(ms(2)io(6)A)-hydroxylase [Prochlorococcus marinus str. SS35]KGG33725.1 tRNA-(ms(2)io(6)A)-hydroxylase [Prochlorococcus marinus